MQNNPIDNLSDFQLTQEILVRGLERKIEDFTDREILDEVDNRCLVNESDITYFSDSDIVNEVLDRGLEDEINDYVTDDVKSLCETILNELNTGQDIDSIKPKIIELIQNVTGKIVCK